MAIRRLRFHHHEGRRIKAVLLFKCIFHPTWSLTCSPGTKITAGVSSGHEILKFPLKKNKINKLPESTYRQHLGEAEQMEMLNTGKSAMLVRC